MEAAKVATSRISKIIHRAAAEEEGFGLITNLLTDGVVTNCHTLKMSADTFLSDSVFNILMAGKFRHTAYAKWFKGKRSEKSLVMNVDRED